MPKGAGAIQGLKNLIARPGQTLYRSLAPKKTLSTGRELLGFGRVRTPEGKLKTKWSPSNTASALKKGWKSTGILDKLMIGGAVAPDALAMAKPSQPGEPGKAERAGRALGTLAGGVAFNKVPMLGSLVGWTAGSMAGAGAGKVVGKVTGVGKAKKGPPAGAKEPSLSDKLNKVGAVHKKLRDFTRKKIRSAKFKEIEPNQMGDIATATWRDPTGTFERVSATENKPHA